MKVIPLVHLDGYLLVVMIETFWLCFCLALTMINLFRIAALNPVSKLHPF